MSRSEDVASEVAKILLDVNAVSINVSEPYIYASGTISPIYCDLRLLMRAPRERDRIVEILTHTVVQSVGKDQVDVVAGVATAGIPWAAWIARALNLPMAYVRDSPKEHGTHQQVEGGVQPGQRAWVFEDLTSTGGSAITAALAMREQGAIADYCCSIFTYGFRGAEQAFARQRINQVALCNISTLLGVAAAQGNIAGEEVNAVCEWLKSK